MPSSPILQVEAATRLTSDQESDNARATGSHTAPSTPLSEAGTGLPRTTSEDLLSVAGQAGRRATRATTAPELHQVPWGSLPAARPVGET